LNEYVDAERSNRFKAAKIKRQTQDDLEIIIRHEINAGRLHRHEKLSALEIEWTEKDRRRDADNIAFAVKFIQDALVEMGVFPDDNRKYIDEISHRVICGDDYSVKVTIKEKKK
jgi:Holliday junction resolvase RusA-like endonuclease